MKKLIVDIVTWVLGLFFVMGAFFTVTDSMLAAALIFAGALLIIPPSRRFVLKKYKMPTWLLGIVIIGLIFTGLVVAGNADEDESQDLANKNTEENSNQQNNQDNNQNPTNNNNQENQNNENIVEIDVSDSFKSANDLIIESYLAISETNLDLAKQKALAAKTQLAKAVENREALSEIDSVQLQRHQTEATLLIKTTDLLKETVSLTQAVSDADGNLAPLLPRVELFNRALKENADDWTQFGALLLEFQSQGADIPLSDTEAALNMAERELDTVQQLELIITAIKTGDHTPIEHLDIKGNAEKALFEPELTELFDSFDVNGNGNIDIAEGQEFFYWVENNIEYRYDNEAVTEPIVGFLVGDGREGTDYRQRPIDTFNEKAGDCEDMATLQQAFYRYFGIAAYVAGVNALGGATDHAAAIVRISDNIESFQNFLGDIVYYEIEEGAVDISGNAIAPGVYMIVDNAYSAAFGYLSNGLTPGTFEMACQIPLHDWYDEKWYDIYSVCGVTMD